MTWLRQSCFALCSLFLLGFGVSANGNLTSKTGITGSYSYSSSQPHAVVGAGGTSYSYDAAGNMTQRGNTSITYNAIGQPLAFYQAASEVTRFAYDSDYNRYYQWAMLANGDTQETFYIGGNYEEKVTHHAGGSTSTEQYAYVNDTVLQVTTGSTTNTRYLLRNALHSVEAVLDSQGQVLERLSYDTWGKPDATPQYTTRSYTGQEYLPRLGLFHLNGRVYDPSLGRFLSADPIVQSPDFSQSYNRYSYVWNNPVSAWDPTGYMTSVEWANANGLSAYEEGNYFIAGVWATTGAIFEVTGGSISRLYDHYALGNVDTQVSGMDFAIAPLEAIPVAGVLGRMGVSAVGSVARFGEDIYTAFKGFGGLADEMGAAIPVLDDVASIANTTTSTSMRLILYYPVANGFLGSTTQTSLRVGQVIDRFGGSDISRFFSPVGTPAVMRALPPSTASQSLRSFEVLKSFNVETGRVAPAFGQLGLGTQYRSSLNLKELLEQGFVLEIRP